MGSPMRNWLGVCLSFSWFPFMAQTLFKVGPLPWMLDNFTFFKSPTLTGDIYLGSRATSETSSEDEIEGASAKKEPAEVSGAEKTEDVSEKDLEKRKQENKVVTERKEAIASYNRAVQLLEKQKKNIEAQIEKIEDSGKKEELLDLVLSIESLLEHHKVISVSNEAIKKDDVVKTHENLKKLVAPYKEKIKNNIKDEYSKQILLSDIEYPKAVDFQKSLKQTDDSTFAGVLSEGALKHWNTEVDILRLIEAGTLEGKTLIEQVLEGKERPTLIREMHNELLKKASETAIKLPEGSLKTQLNSDIEDFKKFYDLAKYPNMDLIISNKDKYKKVFNNLYYSIREANASLKNQEYQTDLESLGFKPNEIQDLVSETKSRLKDINISRSNFSEGELDNLVVETDDIDPKYEKVEQEKVKLEKYDVNIDGKIFTVKKGGIDAQIYDEKGKLVTNEDFADMGIQDVITDEFGVVAYAKDGKKQVKCSPHNYDADVDETKIKYLASPYDPTRNVVKEENKKHIVKKNLVHFDQATFYVEGTGKDAKFYRHNGEEVKDLSKYNIYNVNVAENGDITYETNIDIDENGYEIELPERVLRSAQKEAVAKKDVEIPEGVPVPEQYTDGSEPTTTVICIEMQGKNYFLLYDYDCGSNTFYDAQGNEIEDLSEYGIKNYRIEDDTKYYDSNGNETEYYTEAAKTVNNVKVYYEFDPSYIDNNQNNISEEPEGKPLTEFSNDDNAGLPVEAGDVAQEESEGKPLPEFSNDDNAGLQAEASGDVAQEESEGKPLPEFSNDDNAGLQAEASGDVAQEESEGKPLPEFSNDDNAGLL